MKALHGQLVDLRVLSGSPERKATASPPVVVVAKKRMTKTASWWQRLCKAVTAAIQATPSVMEELYRLYDPSLSPETTARPETVELNPARAVSLRRQRKQTRLEVIAGTVWLTDGTTPGDVILKAGETLELRPEHHYVLQALHGNSRICLRPTENSAARAG